MPENRDSKNRSGKVSRPASGRPYSEPRAAVNRRPESAYNRSLLPRLRSGVPSGPKGLQNNQINTFLPKYFKHQKDRTSKPIPNMEVSRDSETSPPSSRRDSSEKAEGLSNTTSPTPTVRKETDPPTTPRPSTEEKEAEGKEEKEKEKDPPPPPPPPPSEGNISLADIMLKLNSLAEMPAKINDIANDLKQIKVLQEQTSKIGKEIIEVQGQVNIIEEKVSKLQEKETENQQHIELLAKEIVDLKAEVKQLKQNSPSTSPQSDFELLKVKADMLKQNIIVEGIREPQEDSLRSAYYQARSFVRDTLGISYAEVDRAYRLGKRRGPQAQPRPLLIRFTRLGDRMDAWEARYKVNSSANYFIKEDLPIPLRPVQAALVRVAQAARKKSWKYPNVIIRDFRLYINDNSYGVEDLERLPEDLRPSSITTPGNSKVVIFFGKDSRFSNHHPSKFVLQNTSYSTIEQYLAAKRATLAGKHDLRDKALASDDPRDAKKVLNALHGDPSDEEWVTKRRDILFDGLLAKFQQNEKLRKYLLSTEQRTLGEASRNKAWGIGLTLTDNGRLDTRNWTGENLLGITLMEVRERLRENTLPQPSQQGPGDPQVPDT